MTCWDNLVGCVVDYSVEDIFDIIKDYDDILLERDDAQAMTNIGPDKESAQSVIEYLSWGCKVELKVFYDENGSVVSDDDDYEDYETILSIQPLVYEDEDHSNEDVPAASTSEEDKANAEEAKNFVKKSAEWREIKSMVGAKPTYVGQKENPMKTYVVFENGITVSKRGEDYAVYYKPKDKTIECSSAWDLQEAIESFLN